MLEIRKKYAKDDRCVTLIAGSFTLLHIKQATTELTALHERYTQLVLDLAAVTEFDSAAFQLLAVFKKAATLRRRKIKLVKHSPVVLDLIELYGAVGLFRDKIVIRQDHREHKFSYGTQARDFIP